MACLQGRSPESVLALWERFRVALTRPFRLHNAMETH